MAIVPPNPIVDPGGAGDDVDDFAAALATSDPIAVDCDAIANLCVHRDLPDSPLPRSASARRQGHYLISRSNRCGRERDEPPRGSLGDEIAMLSLHLERVLPAPPAVVFRMYAEPELLAQWWGPDGFTSPTIELDLRVGGRYRIAMQPPEGESFVLAGEFRAVDTPTRLVYTFRWEPPDVDAQLSAR